MMPSLKGSSEGLVWEIGDPITDAKRYAGTRHNGEYEDIMHDAGIMFIAS